MYPILSRNNWNLEIVGIFMEGDKELGMSGEKPLGASVRTAPQDNQCEMSNFQLIEVTLTSY